MDFSPALSFFSLKGLKVIAAVQRTVNVTTDFYFAEVQFKCNFPKMCWFYKGSDTRVLHAGLLSTRRPSFRVAETGLGPACKYPDA